MLCENCKKYEATTHVKQTVNGKSYEAYLCPHCYGKISGNLNGLFDFGDFGLGNLFDGFFAPSSLQSKRQTKKCEFCGSTLSDISKIGRVGCADCYTVFKEELTPTIKKIHGNGVYSGELPKSASDEVKKQRTLKDLKAKLQKAIDSQEFEQAAKIRDEIKAIEGKESK